MTATRITQPSDYTTRRPACSAARHSFVSGLWQANDTGNGAIRSVAVCRHCGCRRATVSSYCGRRSDDSVTYTSHNADDAKAAEIHRLEEKLDGLSFGSPEYRRVSDRIESLRS